MIRSIDTLKSNFEVLQKRQEAISANIANVNTNGYQEKKLFQSTLKNVQLHNFMGEFHVRKSDRRFIFEYAVRCDA